MDIKQISNFIKEIQLFHGLDQEQIELISKNVIVKSYKKMDYLFKENSIRESIFLIFSGDVELYKNTPFGEEVTLAVFKKYDFLGEGAVSEKTPHSTSARVLNDSEIFVLNKDLFFKYPQIAIKLLSNTAKVIARRMRHSNMRFINSSAQYESGRTRIEHDLLGEREVPAEVYYGLQTMRAMENFGISGITLSFYPILIESLAVVKMAAAMANYEIGILSEDLKDAIVKACEEIINKKFHNQFVVDMIQGGAGTSTNMNANEVIANRALEIMGYSKGEYKYCHPNSHVNLSQSTNDVYPTAVKLALYKKNQRLVKTLKELASSFRKKAEQFSHILKMGRTQLQDAVPMTLGQSFGAMAKSLEDEIIDLQYNSKQLLTTNMGGTAIGTGINADPKYSDTVVKYLKKYTNLDIVLAEDLVEETQDTVPFMSCSAAIKRLATKLSKICNDLRLLSSGPRTGLNEINLPPMQPGSSIMPGKVNPVIPEVVNQIAFKVIGNDLTVTLASEAGQLELNVMEPVITQSIFESIEMLRNGMKVLKYRCIDGITANEDICRGMIENSIGIVTALNPALGYENCSMVAKEALRTGRSVYDLVIEKKLLSKEKLDQILKPENMIKPQKRDI